MMDGKGFEIGDLRFQSGRRVQGQVKRAGLMAEDMAAWPMERGWRPDRG